MFLLSIFSSFAFNSFATENPKTYVKNAVFIEAFGHGGYGSLNYERLLLKNYKKNMMLTLKTGFGVYNVYDYTVKFNPDLIFPSALSFLYGKNHKLEIGIGKTISSFIEADRVNYLPHRIKNEHANFLFGYRFQKETKAWMFRASYSPIYVKNKTLVHWAGVSFGYAF